MSCSGLYCDNTDHYRTSYRTSGLQDIISIQTTTGHLTQYRPVQDTLNTKERNEDKKGSEHDEEIMPGEDEVELVSSCVGAERVKDDSRNNRDLDGCLEVPQ